MGSYNQDVPLEAVLKYIKQDRDKYKAKLDELIPYTKSLEKKVKVLEEDGVEDAKKLKNKMALLEARNIGLEAELKALRTNYKQSEWYKDLKEQRKRYSERNKILKQALNRALTNNLDDEKIKDLTIILNADD